MAVWPTVDMAKKASQQRVAPLIEDSPELASSHLLHAARADLLRRSGRAGEAADAYRVAVGLATNDAERAFLTGRLAETTR